MKKTVLSIFVLAAVLVALGFVFTACENSTGGGNSDGGDGGGQKDILDGTTWEVTSGDIPSGSGGVRGIFNAPNFQSIGITNGTVYASGTYTVSGNSVNGTITGGQYGSGTFYGTITNNGNTLQATSIVSGDTKSMTLTKKSAAKDILDGTAWEALSGDSLPSGGVRVTFYSPNFVCTQISNSAVLSAGTYTVTGSSINGKSTDSEGHSGTFYGTISGNKLQWTSTSNGMTLSGTATKK
jgi:hypothetical protein